jgi:O-antigen/teichoic acid export membrane protein
MQHINLYQSVLRSGFWVFSLRVVQLIFSFARITILARVLAPHDFGLLGIALLTMTSLETFSQTGFQQALIQKKENIESYLDVAWTVLLLRGLLLFMLLFFIAPYAASFFNTPEAMPIIRVIAFSLLLQALTNIGVIYFQKELEFNKQFLYQISGLIADFTIAVLAALILKSVWALVFGLLAGNAVRCLVSYFIHPYRPHLSRNFEKAKEIFGYGKWILGASILTFLLSQGDDVFVGKIIGVSALGFYQIAYRFSNMPAVEISHVISQVTFPAYSKLQDSLDKLKRAYLKVTQLSAFLSFPIGGLIIILAPEFTAIFLGEKWMPMIPALRILTIYGVLRAIGATTGTVFMAVGRPEIMTKIKVGQLILLAILIYPFSMRWGIVGTALAVTAHALIFNPVAVYMVLKTVGSNFTEPFKIIVLPLICTAIMVGAILLVKMHLFTAVTLTAFIALVVSGVFIYLLITILFDIVFNYGSIHLIQEQIKVLLRNKEDN